MQRATVYLKVELEYEKPDSAQKIGGELARMLEKQHGVRQAEVTNTVES